MDYSKDEVLEVPMMEHMLNSELLNCPFCGETASLAWRDGKYGRFAFVECDFCSAMSRTYGNVIGTPEDSAFWLQNAFKRAMAAWNRRVNA